ncbi:MAG: hypothetical protein M9958_07150 [Chitinophagales bacterium]|nr:hypothetical protein [Chitinophagales bacterium]
MPQKNLVHKQLLLFIFILLFTIPCSIKNEIKLWIGIEYTNFVAPIKAKTCPTSFQSSFSNASYSQVENKKLIVPLFKGDVLKFKRELASKLNQDYLFYKEKVPTHIVIQQFLI